VAAFCEHSNVPPGSITKGYFLTFSFSNLIPHHEVNFMYACTSMKIVIPFMAVRSSEVT
jgi:hypothetical protein